MQKCKLRFSGLLIPVLATIICFAASSIEISFAQHAKGLPKSIAPVPLLPAPIPSPQISPNGMATFQLVMPKAAKVSLNLEGVGHPIPMKKQTHGTWTVRVPNLAMRSSREKSYPYCRSQRASRQSSGSPSLVRSGCPILRSPFPFGSRRLRRHCSRAAGRGLDIWCCYGDRNPVACRHNSRC